MQFLFADDMIIYIGSPRRLSYKKTMKNNRIMWAGYVKINIKKTVGLLSIKANLWGKNMVKFNLSGNVQDGHR